MLKYLIVPLSEYSESYCHYVPVGGDSALSFIDPESLSRIIFWAMRENLSIQFVYPKTRIPAELKPIINSIDHINIVPEGSEDKELLNEAEIIVTDNLNPKSKMSGRIYIVRVSLADLLESPSGLKSLLERSIKVNVVITDLESFSKDAIEPYREFLHQMSEFIAGETIKGGRIQLNLITDRMMLSEMNNCNAGVESVAVSSDGTLYPCPAFMSGMLFACGNIQDGFDASGLRLLQISNAPVCKVCDAFQCKRCVWLNRLLTHEVNTPGWQQCVVAHLEREAARHALLTIRKDNPDYLQSVEIPEIDYLDPFTKIEKL